MNCVIVKSYKFFLTQRICFHLRVSLHVIESKKKNRHCRLLSLLSRFLMKASFGTNFQLFCDLMSASLEQISLK